MSEESPKTPSDAEAQAAAAAAQAAAEAAAAEAAAAAAKKDAKQVRARVLQDCEHGKANDLVTLPEPVAKAAEKSGLVDTDKAAVAYAASLANSKE